MELFKKKENLSENIAFMAIMAAINVVFVIMTTFIPFLLFILVFLLPLSCTLVMLLCRKEYFVIYFVSTILLCLATTFWNISDTLFYIIPSMITGSLFALFINKRIQYQYSILICTIVQTCLSYLSLPLIKLITTIDILELYTSFFTFDTASQKIAFQLIAVVIISLLQEIISYFTS